MPSQICPVVRPTSVLDLGGKGKRSDPRVDVHSSVLPGKSKSHRFSEARHLSQLPTEGKNPDLHLDVMLRQSEDRVKRQRLQTQGSGGTPSIFLISCGTNVHAVLKAHLQGSRFMERRLSAWHFAADQLL